MRFCLITLTIGICACTYNQTRENKTINNNLEMTETNTNTIGDCFTFKDSALNHFGLILIQNLNNETNFIPVQLKISETGLEKFRNGQVYFNSYPDLAHPNENIEGEITFFFSKDEIDWISKQINIEGHLNLKQKYLQITGAVSISGIEQLKQVLNNWNIFFSKNGELISVNQML